MSNIPSRYQIAAYLSGNGMHCNCDLDNWQPELSTGHSHVCRIYKFAIAASADLVEKVRLSQDKPHDQD